VSFSQERSFYLRLSGRENLLFYARLRGQTRAEATRRVDRLCEELELKTILATCADRCSTGMIQQLAFARVLTGEPQLLLLDEPTRSLDEEAFAKLWAAIDRRPDTLLSSLRTTRTTLSAALAASGFRFPRASVVVAIARRDYRVTRSYRLAFGLDLLYGALELALYLFISKVVGPVAVSSLAAAPTYFAFAAVGLVLGAVPSVTAYSVSSDLRNEQLTGTLEVRSTPNAA
jgi:hypothetical protein